MKDLLNTPLKDLTQEELMLAFQLRERELLEIEERNKAYVMRTQAGVHVITDAIEVKSMADGQVYDSKSRYYESLKRHGSHVVEPGEQVPGKSREVRGDFDVGRELKGAVERHLR